MFQTFLVITVYALSSCALFQKEDYSDVMYDYLKPTEGRAESLSSHQIKKVLSKETAMAGGNYQLSITPIPNRLVKAYYQEMTFKNGLNEREQEKLWKDLTREYLDNKTCLHFEYQVVHHQKVKNLDAWKVSIKDHAGQDYPVTWKKKPIFSRPAAAKLKRDGKVLDQWIYEGTGCADTNIPLEKEFGVKVTPSYVQWPFPSSKDFWWEFDHIVKTKDGIEEKVEKKKRTYQKYRGY